LSTTYLILVRQFTRLIMHITLVLRCDLPFAIPYFSVLIIDEVSSSTSASVRTIGTRNTIVEL
jgi:hypothetical protein